MCAASVARTAERMHPREAPSRAGETNREEPTQLAAPSVDLPFMKTSVALSVLALMTSCSPERPLLVAEPAATDYRESVREAPDRIIAGDATGALWVLDAETGQRLSSLTLPRPAATVGQLEPGRLFAHLPANEEEEGAVLELRLEADDSLSVASERGAVPMDTGLWALPWGLLAVGADPSPRWKPWTFDGPPVSSTACPVPRDVEIPPADDAASASVRALRFGEQGEARILELVCEAGQALDCAPLGLDHGALPAPTALAQSEHLGPAAVGAAGGRLVFYCLSDGAVSATLEQEIEASDVLSVKLLDDGFERAVFGVLLTDPPTLAVVRASTLEAPALAAALVSLGGPVPGGEGFPAPRLAAARGSLYVAGHGELRRVGADGEDLLVDGAGLGVPVVAVSRAR